MYDPTNEPRNGLITTPNQPQLQGFGNQPNLNGAQGRRRETEWQRFRAVERFWHNPTASVSHRNGFGNRTGIARQSIQTNLSVFEHHRIRPTPAAKKSSNGAVLESLETKQPHLSMRLFSLLNLRRRLTR